MDSLIIDPITDAADFAVSMELIGLSDDDAADLAVEYALSTTCGRHIVSLSSQDADDRLVFATVTDPDDDTLRWTLTVRLPAGFLDPGSYHHQARFRRISTDETTPIFEGWPVIQQGAF